MLTILPSSRNWGAIAAGLVPIVFAMVRWVEDSIHPKRFVGCGNCWLGDVGIPLEFGLLGTVVVWRTLRRADLLQQDAVFWFLAFIGILLTPYVIGVPFYLASLLMLVWPD